MGSCIKYLFILFFIPLSLFSQDNGTKEKIVGNVISLGVGAITYELTDKKGLSIAVGFGCGVLAQVIKEYIYDDQPRNKQILDASWGSSIGSLMVIVYIDGRENRKDKIKNIKKF